MQVVSGRIDKPTVHFEAPAYTKVPGEMEQFLPVLTKYFGIKRFNFDIESRLPYNIN